MHANPDSAPNCNPPHDDPEGWGLFLQDWYDRYSDRIVSPNKLVSIFREASISFDALSSTPRGFRTILNRSLFGTYGRLYDPFVVETFSRAENGTLGYRLRRLVPLSAQETDRRG